MQPPLRQALLILLCACPALAQSTRPASRSAPATRPTTHPTLDLLAPTRITLHLKDVTPQAAYNAFATQAGITIKPFPANLFTGVSSSGHTDPIPQIDLENVSFWQAARILARKTNLALRMGGTNRDLLVAAGSAPVWERGPSFESGPFLAVANHIFISRAIDLNNGADIQRACSVRLTLYAEPRVRVLKGFFNAVVDQATDDKGHPLISTPLPTFNERMQPAATMAWPIQLQLTPPANAGESIGILKAHVQVLVQTQSEILDIPDIAAAMNQPKTLGARKLTIRDLKKNGDTAYTLSLTLQRDPANPSDWSDINLTNTIRLLDESGRPLSRRTYGTAGSTAPSVNLNLMFGREDGQGGPLVGTPVRLIWDVPTQTRTLTVPFEFHDLPLP
jgi:hypothetical protein